MPNLEVHRLARANAQQDSQHFQIGDLLCQRRVEARATLLDEAKVEARCTGNCLKGVGDGAAVARPPTCVYRQLFEVGEPPLLRNPGYLAGWQNGKAAQIDWFCPL